MRLTILAWLIGIAVFTARTTGDPRPFTFVYDTYPIGKGNVEYEQWVTYRASPPGDHDAYRIDLRHEFEIGLAENFDLSIYLANWRYEDTEDHTGTQYDGSSVEGIFYLSNPVTDFVGIGLYAEFGIGEHEVEFEQKLLVQKDIGKFSLAYNFIVETEVSNIFTDAGEDSAAEVEGELGNAFGVSYSVTPHWRVGAEALVETEFANWSDPGATTAYLGPNFSYQGGAIPGTKWGWWVTITPLFQLTNVDDAANIQLRMIAGIEF